MNQATIDALNQWASQIENAVVKAAPAVWTTAVHVKQADAIGAFVTNLCEAALLLIFTIILGRYAIRFGKSAWLRDEKVGADYGCGEIPGLGAWLLCAVCAVGGIVSAVYAWSAFAAVAFDQWVWIGATNPGLAVSHDIIVKILSQ